MKAIVIVLAMASLPAGVCHAGTQTAIKPGVMCKSADSLAKLTLLDGSSRYSGPQPRPGDEKLWLDGNCLDIPPGAQVTVQTMHKNTSVVTYQRDDDQGPQTYIIANIDFAANPPAIAPPPGGCVPDSSHVTLTGFLREIHSRDRRNGSPYSYFSLHTQQGVCLSGADMDDSNATPRLDITIIEDHGHSDDLRRHLGASVISGKLESSNGGGPQLFNPVFH